MKKTILVTNGVDVYSFKVQKFKEAMKRMAENPLPMPYTKMVERLIDKFNRKDEELVYYYSMYSIYENIKEEKVVNDCSTFVLCLIKNAGMAVIPFDKEAKNEIDYKSIAYNAMEAAKKKYQTDIKNRIILTDCEHVKVFINDMFDKSVEIDIKSEDDCFRGITHSIIYDGNWKNAFNYAAYFLKHYKNDSEGIFLFIVDPQEDNISLKFAKIHPDDPENLDEIIDIIHSSRQQSDKYTNFIFPNSMDKINKN